MRRFLVSFLLTLFACILFIQPAFADVGQSGTTGQPPPSSATQSGTLTAQSSNNSVQSGQSPGTESLNQVAQSQLDSLPTGVIEQYWNSLQQQYGGYLPDAQSGNIIRSILENGGWNLHGLIHGILRYFFSEVFDNIRLLGAILLLSVLAVILQSLQSAFEQQTVSQIAYAVIFFVLIGLAIGSFTEAVGYAKHAIQSMTDFMLATVPLVVTLMAASGAVTSAAFFQPMLVFAVHLISNVIFLFVFPMIFFAAILDLVSSLSPRYQVTRLAGFFRTAGVATLGLCLSAFLGVASVQGLGKGVADGVTLRLAKFSVNTFVPIVGKAMSDAAETVVSASMLVKNAVGVAGLLIVLCLALFPALKILALSMIYNGSAALMQPLGDGPMVKTLGSLSKTLVLVFACVAAVALMFFMAICILLLSANIAVVMS
ncbi:stage III sporulation protein AE [Alicyclobacillus ferrooxydans]|uniref:stage III sporulation protein AE n=1 Tax=Alicyclobacillus ferrooxydans TaxID=471514 RepID=UPI000A524613|nr:stage III sporulation protein AE [Alicyclobacillus ferrooxydans]